MPVPFGCWENPPHTLALAENKLHLWRIALNVSPATQRILKSTLSPDECSRSDQLLDPQKALAFVIARGRLRQILGRYLEIQPSAITFSYGRNGKPAVHADFHAKVSFNLSHSGEWALLAVALDTNIGVDLEQIDPLANCRAMATHFFTAQENLTFNHFAQHRQRRGFYRIWVRKEAGLKSSGLGFSADPNGEQNGPGRRSYVFPVWKNYLGAIATSDVIDSIQRYQLIER